MKHTIFLLFLLSSFSGKAQLILRDSIRLVSIQGESITKVIAKESGNEILGVGWKTITDTTITFYSQTFSSNGVPLMQRIKISEEKLFSDKDLDFHIALDSEGNTIFAWSQYDSINDEYPIFYQIFDYNGTFLDIPKQIGLSTESEYVKVSINTQNEFLISWQKSNTEVRVRLFDENRILKNKIIDTRYSGKINSKTYPVEINDSSKIVMTWANNFYYDDNDTFGLIRIIDENGKVSDYKQGGSGNSCCNYATDMDFEEQKTVLSYSSSTSTFLAIMSRYTRIYDNIVVVDSITSNNTQISQNKQGIIFMAWSNNSEILNTSYFLNSGIRVPDPFTLNTTGSNNTIASFDVHFKQENKANLVYALNDTLGTRIILQQFDMIPIVDTEEIIANKLTREKSTSIKALSSNKNHVNIWKYKGENESAIYAQIYDSLFQEKGEELILVYNSGGSDYSKIDAAIDNSGNFMIVWQQTGNENVYAKKFNNVGEVSIEQFTVNTVQRTDYDFPRISASNGGDFVVLWNYNRSSVKARLIKNNGDDSGEIIINGCCQGSNSYSDFAYNHVAINDNDKVVMAYRSGYYDLTIAVYNTQFDLLSRKVFGILDTYSKFDIEINSQDQIVLVWYQDDPPMIQHYNTDLEKVGDSFQFPVITKYLGQKYWISMASNDKYCISYNPFQSDYHEVQIFSSNGLPEGEPLRLETFEASSIMSVSYNSHNSVFASWTSRAHFYDNYIDSKSDVVSKGKTLVDIDMIPDTTKLPQIPQQIKITTGDKYIDISWLADSTNLTNSYIIYKNVVDDFATSVLLDSTTNTNYLDHAVSYDVTYFYWLRAKSSSGAYSSYSQPISGMPVNKPPSKPVGFLVNLDSGKIQLSWEKNLETALKEYFVFRNNINNKPSEATVIDKSTDSIYFDDLDFTHGNVIYYWVKASDHMGRLSEFSDVGIIYTLEGTVQTENGIPLKDVEVKLSGHVNHTSYTDENGHYSFLVTPNEVYTITPTMNVVADGGVTTLDLVMYMWHILNRRTLPSAMRAISGDVNNSQSLTALDIVHIRSIILHKKEWWDDRNAVEFVSSNYTGNLNVNTFVYENSISTTPDSSQNGLNFTGFKLGDANQSWWPGANARESFDGEIQLIFGEPIVQNKLMKIPIYPERMNHIIGMQFTLNWNANDFNFAGFESCDLGKWHINDDLSSQGQLPVLWSGEHVEGTEIDNNSVLVYLVLEKMSESTNPPALVINSAITPSMAYNQNLESFRIISKTSSSFEDELTGQKLVLYPNPATDVLYLSGTDINEALEYNLINILGKRVKHGKIDHGKTIDVRKFTPGIYILEVTDSEGRVFKNRIVIE